MKKLLVLLCLFCCLLSCKTGQKSLVKITAKTIPIDSILPAKQAIKNFVAPYKEEMASKINTVITYSPKALVKTNVVMQSSLGNLLADLCYDIANPVFRKKTAKNIDFAMFNYGGMRAGIPKGKVTVKDVFELMPFENTLVVTKLSGKKIKALIHYFIKSKIAHPLSRQIQLRYTKDSYSLVIKGKPFDAAKTYDVLTSNYLQEGGDRMNFFKNPLRLTRLNLKIRDVIITYFKKVDTLKTPLDNRVIKK